MKFYISNLNSWAPGATTKAQWLQWKDGSLEIQNEKISPKIEFTDPLFRRRFSQITKMTVQVVHDLIEEIPQAKESKILFTSFRGEIEREFAIDRMLIEDKMILPAAFSLSVFNTPIAAATIAMGLKSGYSVIYPSKGNFNDALLSGAASVLSGDEKQIVFVYADEKIPDAYGKVIEGNMELENSRPLAFACILSSVKEENSVEFDTDVKVQSVEDFLKKAIDSMGE